ncbi:MAG: hypothetical protein JWO36_7289 [Myxococcales bacterium]|nr:hypothetical protein [Myxococcales bacterium]
MRLFSIVGFIAAAGCATQTSDPFTSDTQTVVMARRGGFAPTPAAGSTCAPMDETYTLVVATGQLSWQVCTSATLGGVYKFQPGSATPSASALSSLEESLHGLGAPAGPCAADIADKIVFHTTTGDTTITSAQCIPGEMAVFTVIHTIAP